MTDGAVLEIKGLSIQYGTESSHALAVDNVDLTVHRGEIVGLVGESGSGKTSIGLAVMDLLPPPGHVVAGEITVVGQSLSALPPDQRRRLRGNVVSMIFQNPMSSLNPTLTIGSQIAEVIVAHRVVGRRAVRDRSAELLELVGIADPLRRLRSYPHELSGGMRQRVMIAMAIALEPDVLIADEPTTALDVTIQAQIIWLLEDLRTRLGMAILYVTHNLAVAARISQTIAVCYRGQIVERAPKGALFARPAHPYTQSLLAAIPAGHWRDRRAHGAPTLRPSSGVVDQCAFVGRCPYAFGRCTEERPPLFVPVMGQAVRCFLHDVQHAANRPRTQDGVA